VDGLGLVGSNVERQSVHTLLVLGEGVETIDPLLHHLEILFPKPDSSLYSSQAHLSGRLSCEGLCGVIKVLQHESELCNVTLCLTVGACEPSEDETIALLTIERPLHEPFAG